MQQQTVQDLEIFVVGDGVPDETRELVRELERHDARIRFFDNPKGPRHGEIHRAVALREASGEIVCYQADDDLWCPDHVRELRALLSDADFAHTVALQVFPDGSMSPWLAVLEAGVFRAHMHRGENFLPLSVAGHRLAAYRALPHGWRTTPRPIPTDLYMWQQFLQQPEIRLASGSRPTVLNFPAPARRSWTLAERLAELERWSTRLESDIWQHQVEPMLAALCAEAVARLRRRLRLLEPLSESARARPLLGKIPRRTTTELWKREVNGIARQIDKDLPYDWGTSPYSLV